MGLEAAGLFLHEGKYATWLGCCLRVFDLLQGQDSDPKREKCYNATPALRILVASEARALVLLH